jgi:uncharacterized protein YoxC
MADFKVYVLAVGIGVLLVLSLTEYVQVASLQSQVSRLQNQVRGIPDTSSQLLQQSQVLQKIQQQVSSLNSEIASLSGRAESFTIVELCVSATTKCQDYVVSAFSVALANNGTVVIPAGSFTVIVSTVGNESYAFSSVTFDMSSSLNPGGPAAAFVLSSWQDAKNSTGTFSPGENVDVSICFSGGLCREQNIVVQA